MIIAEFARWADQMLAGVRERESFDIGTPERVYMRRWFVIPRNKLLNVYHHEFQYSDDDRALHDHPWWSISLLTHGHVRDIKPDGFNDIRTGELTFRTARSTHRIVLTSPVARSLFITGPVVREWGFHCPQGWRHWKDFTAYKSTGNKGAIGPGCD